MRGHKTDRKNAEWLADLLQLGLLQPSFIPPPDRRALRELTRYRESLVREHTAVANRIQKVIESGNIKLGQVASDLLGRSGPARLRSLAKGERDAAKLANLARGKLRDKMGELVRALQGQLTEMQRFVLDELLARADELEAAEDQVSQQITRYINDPQRPKLALAWKLLDSIPGIGPRVAEVVIAEIGVQMREFFPTDAHLASWAGWCPGQKESAGKRQSGKTRHGNRYLRSALVQAAWAVTLHGKQTYLAAQYSHLVRRWGRKKALVAVAHSLIVMIYHVLDREVSDTSLGGDYFDRQQVGKQRAYYLRRLEALGLKVTVEEMPAAA